MIMIAGSWEQRSCEVNLETSEKKWSRKEGSFKAGS